MNVRRHLEEYAKHSVLNFAQVLHGFCGISGRTRTSIGWPLEGAFVMCGSRWRCGRGGSGTISSTR